MVLSRNDKRKRKEGDIVDLVDPIAEAPKRTKIHAQRKFAQGAVTPAFSPASTPVKEKEKAVKPSTFTELITHRRPNTEDFLTFLCFRGTSILPPSLNFFSTSPKKEKPQDDSKTPPTSIPHSKTNGTCEKLVKPAKKDQSTAPTPKSSAKNTNTTKKQATAPIPKNIKLKTTSTAIQALKKKYQEQRLAKQRMKKKLKPTNIKTRSCATVEEQVSEKSVVTKPAATKKNVKKTKEKKRHGLRSMRMPENEKKSLPLKSVKKTLPIKLKTKILASKDDKPRIDSLSLRNSTKRDTLASKSVISKQLQNKTKHLLEKSKKIAVQRVTRSQGDNSAARSKSTSTANLSKRPSRKTKEAAAVYMELLGRKLISPDLENEDNMSLDSFPELPSSKKLSQNESEVKTKVKATKTVVTTNIATKDKKKENTNDNSVSNTKSVKRKVTKPIAPLKSKRVQKVQKYSEPSSDDESVSSNDTIQMPERKVLMDTRRSALVASFKTKKLNIRNIRSTRSLVSSKKSVTKTSNETLKVMKSGEPQSKIKSSKETNSAKETNKDTSKDKQIVAAKRKREYNQAEKKKNKEKVKESPIKQKSEGSKNKSKVIISSSESEEDIPILQRTKKKKDNEKNNEKDQPVKETLAKKSVESKSTKQVALTAGLTVIPKSTLATPIIPKTTVTTTASKSVPAALTSKPTTIATSKIVKNTVTPKSSIPIVSKAALTTVTTSKTTPAEVVSKNTVASTATAKSTVLETLKSQTVSTTAVKTGDEESLRGFAKKANKITSAIQSHVNENNSLPIKDDADNKKNMIKSNDLLVSSALASIGLKDVKKINVKSAMPTITCIKLIKDQPVSSVGTNNSLAANPSVKLAPDLNEIKSNQLPPKMPSAPTASHNIIDMPKAFNHGRKERVNMSTEQIEKWLNESSLAKEESKVEMESVSNFKYETPIINKPKSHLSVQTDKLTYEDISPYIQHLCRPGRVLKLPELSNIKFEKKIIANLKCETPIIHKPKSHLCVQTTPTHQDMAVSPYIQHLCRPGSRVLKLPKPSDSLKKTSTDITANKPAIFLSNSQISPVKPQQLPTVMMPKPKLPPGDIAKEKKDVTTSSSKNNTPPRRKLSKDSSLGEDHADSDAVSKSDVNSVSDSADKKSIASSPEKKVFFHQRKAFLPKSGGGKERPAVAATNTSSTTAFSPENESSVYAFESEAETPVSTPFRRKIKESVVKDLSSGLVEKEKLTTSAQSMTSGDAKSNRKNEDTAEASNDKSLNSTEEARKNEEKSANPLLEKITPKNFELPKNFADLTNVQVLPLDKLTTSWSNVNYSASIASIAVQVNLEKDQQKQQQSTIAESNNECNANQKSTEISTQTETNADNDDDNDSGQLFYIPLQAVTRNTSAQGGQQLIQGVAVKLGTEGPTGPNQRVLLKAKLVTKPPTSVARCPPIGTVQPTARTPQNSEQINEPSTSSDSELKSPTVTEKVTKVGSIGSGLFKTPSPEKILKSPKSKERKMSNDSLKIGKKALAKLKQIEIHSPINTTRFPKPNLNEEARLVEAPMFCPSEKDFQDPLEYIDKIRPIAEKFGICKVVPPSNFKPECKVSDDMRFTAYNQYVHRMLNRWGPNAKEMMAIKKYLATQSISLTQPPWIGGMEVDLPHLYQTVQTLGGLKEVIEKKKWQKVADGMKIPRSAQDRVTKLDDIYCKYLLPYDTLSQDERNKLFEDVESDWVKREKRDRQETQSNDNDDEDEEDNSDEIEECIVKGRNMPLNAFYRIARNTQRMWFGENQRSETEGASADEVETAFWRHVVEKKRHVCVHSASIDSGGRGFGFSVAKNSPFGRHPWNLKILTNNAGSVLRALGPQMGVTVPTLHVGMLFSTCCWYRDPHGLPWIEYLHTGARKIWYGIPNEQNVPFRAALTKMFPRYCKDKEIWLPSDTAMVPPDMLVSNGIPLCQTVQEPGQFIVVFPKAFTSSVCTGYVVSESVYFAQPSWLETAEQLFQDLQESCEPSIFSFERLLFSIINDSRSHIDVLKKILPTVIRVCDREIENRKKIKELGLTNTEKLPQPDCEKKGKNKKVVEEEGDYECDTCRKNLFVSLVSNPTDESILCLTHAIPYIENKKQVLKNCTLMYTYSESELNDLIRKLKERIEAKSKKTNQTKQAK